MPDDEQKMAILDFTLSEEGVLVFHDVLACVLRFSEDVCLEARKDRLSLSALNSTKSAYASFNFTASRFFSTYEFTGSPQNRERFFCSLYIRSLLSVFRTRLGGDPSRERDKETTIDHCEVTIDDVAGAKSRLVAKIVSRNGITATHALPFESKPPVHAKFDKDEAVNHWSISSRTLRQLMDHFGPGIELLDINTEDESVVNFCCFTEKVVKANNAELLKKPLQTSIAVDKEEFDDLAVQDKLHIIVNVKDFRAILHHAQSTSGELSARYSNPGKPMKLFYNGDGMLCEFVLMTIGDRTNLAQKLRKGKGGALNGVGQRLEAASSRSSSVPNAAAPTPKEPPQAQEPPPKPISKPPPPQFEIRPPPLPPISTLRSESLFVMQPDEDQEWEPMNHDDEEDMGETTRLEWDASGQQHLSASTMRISDHQPSEPEPQQEVPSLSPSGLEPTQRLAEVRRFGLFSP